MTSSVSIVSDFVANGHQIILYDSCSPSKIPYSGFSPVRLQTENPPRPSPVDLEIKRMTRIPSSPTNLYAAIVHLLLSPRALCLQVLPDGLFRPEALGSPAGYVVPPGLRLLRPHEPLSVSPTGLSISPRRVFVLRSDKDGYREVPQFTPRVSLTVPPSVPRQTRWTQHRLSEFRLRTFRFQPFRLLVPKSLKPCSCFLYPKDCSTSIDSGLRLLCIGSASAFSTPSVPRWAVLRGCNIRFMLRPGELLALHRQELLLSSFRPLESPPWSVEYNYPAKQSITGARLSLARHAALWAANRGHRDHRDFSKKQ